MKVIEVEAMKHGAACLRDVPERPLGVSSRSGSQHFHWPPFRSGRLWIHWVGPAAKAISLNGARDRLFRRMAAPYTQKGMDR